MADLLNTGISGLLAYRRALDAVSNNIANANTPGYSRQRVELGTQPATPTGYGTIGTGVAVTTVRRLGDALISARVQSDASAYARLETFAGFASRIDRLASDPAAGLAEPLANFFDAANALAQNPAGTAPRQSLIGAAETLAARLRETQSQLDGMDGEINQRLQATVAEINGLTGSIGTLNARIADGQGQFGQPPNDLLDQRDQLLAELSAKVGINTVAQADGSLDVFTASGQALVLGSQSVALGTAADTYGSGRLEITYGSTAAVITRQLGGGALGGLLDARRELVDPARAELGRLAVGLAQGVNAQLAQGVDLQNNAGAPLFAQPAGTAHAASGNAGDAGIAVGFADAGALSAGDYTLRYDGAAWQLSDARSGASLPLSGSGTAADPLRAAGLSLTVSGTPAAGDRFLLRPTTHAAGEIRVALREPALLAAAAPGGGSGDNRNAQALAALADRGLFDGGRSSLLQAHAALVAGAGADAQQATQRRDAQGAIRSQTLAERESAAGVNLDEEAADLIRFQQAYQAAARVIQVADTVFQTLLQATGR